MSYLSNKTFLISCECAQSLVSQTTLTSTLCISLIQALSCIKSLIETPTAASSAQSSAIPPGLSLTVMLKRRSLPSAAKPLSRHRPNIVVSIFPPHSNKTTLKKNYYYFE